MPLFDYDLMEFGGKEGEGGKSNVKMYVSNISMD